MRISFPPDPGTRNRLGLSWHEVGAWVGLGDGLGVGPTLGTSLRGHVPHVIRQFSAASVYVLHLQG